MSDQRRTNALMKDKRQQSLTSFSPDVGFDSQPNGQSPEEVAHTPKAPLTDSASALQIPEQGSIFFPHA